jgi:hypothetical protein
MVVSCNHQHVLIRIKHLYPILRDLSCCRVKVQSYRGDVQEGCGTIGKVGHVLRGEQELMGEWEDERREGGIGQCYEDPVKSRHGQSCGRCGLRGGRRSLE